MRARRLAAALAVACAALLALGACSSSGHGASGATTGDAGRTAGGASSSGSGKHLVIGWADPDNDQPLFQSVTAALNAAAARENARIITLDSQGNPAKQVSQINTFITDKVDVIVVYTLDATSITPSLTKAAQAGIKIVGLNAILPAAPGDTPTVPAPYSTNLDFGYVDAACDAGKYVAEQLHGTGNVLGVGYFEPVPSLIAIVESYQKCVTAGHPGIHWLGSAVDNSDGIDGGRTAVANAVTRYHGNIQAVLAYDDIAAIGAYQALSSAGVKNAVVIGQQGNQLGINAVRSGQIQGDIQVAPATAAIYMLAAAKDLASGVAVPKFIRLPYTLITKANLNTYVPWDTEVSDIKSGKTSLDVILNSK